MDFFHWSIEELKARFHLLKVPQATSFDGQWCMNIVLKYFQKFSVAGRIVTKVFFGKDQMPHTHIIRMLRIFMMLINTTEQSAGHVRDISPGAIIAFLSI